MHRTCLAVILAAGDSTRMKSSMSKVLHPIAGLSMIAHVMQSIRAADMRDAVLVVGRDADKVTAAASIEGLSVSSVLQTERKGTGHAVLMARDAIANGYDDVLVTYGDVPLVKPQTFLSARAKLAEGADVVVIGFQAANPFGYGRLLVEDGELVAIREEKDATDEERKVTWCNSGLMVINGARALEWLEKIGNQNAKGEYYLTDVVEIARASGGKVVAIDAPEAELAGCNTRAELALLEASWQQARRRAVMLSGVTMIAPETVFLSHDTEIGQDTLIEPNVVFGPGVVIEPGVVIHAFSHIEGAHVASGASVGPFARLRPGAKLASSSRVGNFCEVKNAAIGEGAKVNHLTYIGDATVGAGSNIGAGTITCNYDGVNKHETIIGDNAFIGSNSALVAPVSIGNGAYVASGSVITENVPDDALAFGRARQEVKPERAKVVRERALALKAEKAGKR
ncbi:bifunctional UDP-N-acetylglucosamine diphosphorylase/glucosamine-1-phosphate N-acetyltransferase GlmU [Rhizobium oryzicola]|uniref:Bifunctional protein GlmU n=1 Tax=Rhizobium oryzicola TaxID=1232668 RepID=A0ABT8SZ50_9HYPH|nr:bifunctional UDP-N-acetylglucosamine diphosphorylase/glucosamine-1-phosphate N-acetyltransferase GlmU [Rhizobium oryzicola]MDO1583636.1 bifunctional UDP-N-acetylglucosamine diphosphorylase/glucosamine-1-phosphate N-acetyltransferase GlmU [Rhizobium oryzicola]